jgi:hypothetical protein
LKPYQIKVLNVAREIMEATQNGTPLLVLEAIFGKTYGPGPHKGPCYGPFAVINEDGLIVTEYIDKHQALVEIDVFSSVQEFVDNLRRLADAANLTQDEATELAEQARLWIKADYRPESMSEIVQP